MFSYSVQGFMHLETNLGGGGYLEIAQHEVTCNFLESVAHCTFLSSEHQVSSGVWLKLALSLLSYYVV